MSELLVVKLGGGEGLNLRAGCDDLAAIARQRPLVVVHGVSAMANKLCEERGVPVRTIMSPSGHSSRYTDPVTRDIYVEAATLVNTEIVQFLHERGINATGLLGDNTAINGERKAAVRSIEKGRVKIVRDDYSGSITSVNAGPIRRALSDGCVPVLPPMAASPDGLLNIDGDRASAAVAHALGAGDLVILSNVRGLYRNFPDESTFVAHVSFQQIESALNWAQGRMKRKVLGAQEALDGGVRRVIISDGRVANPVTRALNAEGTVFHR